MFEKLGVPEKEDVAGIGPLGSFSKVSIDGRLVCQRIPETASTYTAAVRGNYTCKIYFDTTSGTVFSVSKD